MTRSDDKNSGEKLQIAILTLAMTAGGFALVTLIFLLFMNPRAGVRAEEAEKDYKELAQLLSSQKMQELRATAKRSAGQDDTQLRDVAADTLKKYTGLKYKSVKTVTPKSIKPGLDVVRQPFDLKPAPLVEILQYVATVENEKKTFQVLSLNLTRAKKTRSGPDGNLWGATGEFRDYVSK